MKVTIKSQALDGFHLPFEAVFFRVYALNYFINQSDGQIVQPGGPFYYEWACTLSGTSLVIPEIQLESTIDALNPAHPEGLRYFAGFYDTGGNPITPFWPKPVFSLDSHPNPTQWAAIGAYNSAGVEFDWTTEHANHYSKEEFDYLLDNPPPVPGRITVRPPLLFDGVTLSIPRASSIQNGYLSRNDFILFSGGEAVAVNSFNLRTGEVVLIEDDVLAALGYTPINKSGDTMTGPLLLPPGPPLNSLQAVTKAYAESLAAGGGIGEYPVSAYGASGSKLTFVGAITIGTTALTLTSPTHDFEVGQGITIVAAGNIASIDVGSNLLVSEITAISGAIITIADAALHTVTASIVKHDDTVAIQDTTDAAYAAGGGTVLFDDMYGCYRINKGFSDINSILKVPFTPWVTGAVAGPPPPMIRFKGNGNNIPAVFTPAATLGPIIQTDLIGADSTTSMLSTCVYSTGFAIDGNQMTVVIEGLTFRTYDNPNICGIDMGMVWNVFLKDVCIDTGMPGESNTLFGGTLPGGSQPTHGTFGLRLPRINTCTVVGTENVGVVLYAIGIIGSELWHTNNTWAFRCGVGVQTHETAANYPITGSLLIVQCATMFKFDGGCVVDLHVEYETNYGGWWGTGVGKFIDDPANVARGIFKYLRIQSDSGGGSASITWTGANNLTIWSLGGFGVHLADGMDFNIGNLNVGGTLKLSDGIALNTLSFGASDSATASGYREIQAPNGPSSLALNMESYWKMDETGGNRLDETGNSTFTEGTAGTVASVPGKTGLGNAASAASGAFLVVGHNSHQVFPTSFSLVGWIKMNTITTGQWHTLFSKQSSSSDIGFYLAYRGDVGRWEFTVTADGSTPASCIISTPTPSTGVWYFVTAVYDDSLHQLSLRIDDGAHGSTTQPFTGPIHTAAVNLSSMLSYPGSAIYGDCSVDEMGMWSRALTGSEITFLYNSGAGRTYPF